MNVARDAVMQLLGTRPPGTWICPSEAARLVAGERGDWRAAMPLVHDTVDALLLEGTIDLSWKGLPLAQREGPYRIARARR